MSEIAVKVDSLSKKYTLKSGRSRSMAETLSTYFNTFSSAKVKRSDTFWALQDISFEVNKGEAIAIVGNNGAGKSTLLKILSKITEPTSGRVEIDGKISSLLEVGTGFHPDLTGRENIFLNGTILGMKRSEIKKKFDEIVSFSGIENFIDTPVKRYSSGMYVRLAFAVAAHLDPEILIIDEVLAVGDVEFQKKCLGKMGEVTGEGRTVLFVSHNMAAAKKLCQTGVFLKEGKLVLHSTIDEVISGYLNFSKEDNDYFKDRSNYEIYNENIILEDVNFEMQDDAAVLNLALSVKEVLKGIGVVVTIYDNSYNLIFKTSTNPIWSNQVYTIQGNQRISLQFDDFNLTGGMYLIGVAISIPGVEFLMKINQAKKIEIPDRNIYQGKVDLNYVNSGYCMMKHKWIL